MRDKSYLGKAIDLFLIGFIAMYFEMLFIRWVPSIIQATAYFPNIILLSSLLGLGIGCLLAGLRFDLTRLFALLVLNMVFLLKKLSAVPIHTQFVRTEYLPGADNARGMSFLFIIMIIFVLNAIIFIPLGQKTGNCLKYFKPLIAYSINIAGGIIGIVAFSVLSYLQLTPFYWFLLGLLPSLWFYASSMEHLVLQGVVLAAIFYNILSVSVGSHWSPYYKIDVYPAVSKSTYRTLGLTILANNSNYLSAVNLTDESVTASPQLKHHRDIYEFPYNFIKPANVLILGAGCGNDTAIALRNGIKDISAVEIDPYIAQLGRTEHPERPYKSDAVHLYVDDARSFIKTTGTKFDLVIFGYLDARMVLSQFSSVRLDGFIYTKEAFKDVKNLLSQNGIVSLTCYVPREWIGINIYSSMKTVFGDDLKVFRVSAFQKNDTAIFLAGPGIRNISAAIPPGFEPYNGFSINSSTSVITDDRPYPYLVGRIIPPHYLALLMAVLAVSFMSVFYVATGLSRRFDGHFFFLGAGFALLEATGITRFALLFGSTWIVNSVVMIIVLCMILLANLYLSIIKSLKIDIVYVLLAISIVLNWLLRPALCLEIGKPGGIIMYSVVLSLPLLFASIIFSGSFRETKDVPTAFAFNVLGAIAGGVCEYISMASGFGFLFVIAAGMYYLSYMNKIPENPV